MADQATIQQEQQQPAAAPAPVTADGAEELNPDGTPLSDNQKKKRAAKAEKERIKAEKAAKLAAEKAAREAADVDFASQNYGKLPLNMSQERSGRKYTKIADISPNVTASKLFSLRECRPVVPPPPNWSS